MILLAGNEGPDPTVLSGPLLHDHGIRAPFASHKAYGSIKVKGAKSLLAKMPSSKEAFCQN